ncbi:MAG TPA: transglutaminase domain-containing protein [Clostridiales bacterium]|nr:transglutaminase domain-containing protein [Clostridiales bacterium]
MNKNTKRFISSIIIFLTLFLSVSSISSAKKEEYIDKANLYKGVITINFKAQNKNKTKVRISKGENYYDYDLVSGDTFALQLGNGKYTVMILENIEGRSYKNVYKEELTLKLKDENDIYLQSIQNINWDKDMKVIKTAKSLTKRVKTDEEKIKIIYNYIIKKIKYDNKKAVSVKSTYIPSIEAIAESKKGICYDYASLYASMLRSVGVPTKLVMGNNINLDVYHAWNEVYIAKTDEWITVDTTFDSANYKNKPSKNIEKNSKDYKVKCFY